MHLKKYWHFWFQLLRSYQAFNARLNNLFDAFPVLLNDFFNYASISTDSLKVLLSESFPIITYSHNRSGKVAQELTDKGFFAIKKLHFYGVKVHTLGLRKPSD